MVVGLDAYGCCRAVYNGQTRSGTTPYCAVLLHWLQVQGTRMGLGVQHTNTNPVPCTRTGARQTPACQNLSPATITQSNSLQHTPLPAFRLELQSHFVSQLNRPSPLLSFPVLPCCRLRLL